MTINKRKKSSRLRASKTHGWGSMKKHRGAGNRGGRGRAGSGKRADSKKPSLWKEEYFGKHGFTSKKQTRSRAINVGELEKEIQKWAASKKITKEKDSYTVDLEKIGFDKLLGKGEVKSKLMVNAKQATKKAIDKITKANGEVKITKRSEKNAKEHTDEPA